MSCMWLLYKVVAYVMYVVIIQGRSLCHVFGGSTGSYLFSSKNKTDSFTSADQRRTHSNHGWKHIPWMSPKCCKVRNCMFNTNSCIFELKSWISYIFFFLQVAYGLSAQMCKVSTQVNDWGKFYLPISIALPEILDQLHAVALVQIVARHPNVQRTRSLCTVLSHTHHKQLECGGNESAGVLNSTVPAAPLPGLYIRCEEPSIAPTAMGSLVQILSMERQSSSVGQTRKWSNSHRKQVTKKLFLSNNSYTNTKHVWKQIVCWIHP